MSREPRIDEEALEKSSSAEEIAGSWADTPLRAFVTEADTAADASEADVSAFVIDVDVADRSELRVVRFPRAADSAVFWFVDHERADVGLRRLRCGVGLGDERPQRCLLPASRDFVGA